MAGEPAMLAATSDIEGWGYVNTVLTQLAGSEGRGTGLARRRLAHARRGRAGRAGPGAGTR